VDLEAHVTRIEANGGFGFGGTVVEKLSDGFDFGLGVLGYSQGTESSTSMVELTARAQ
jgi:hypothetical protein